MREEVRRRRGGVRRRRRRERGEEEGNHWTRLAGLIITLSYPRCDVLTISHS